MVIAIGAGTSVVALGAPSATVPFAGEIDSVVADGGIRFA
jgi:hypothetical protein